MESGADNASLGAALGGLSLSGTSTGSSVHSSGGGSRGSRSRGRSGWWVEPLHWMQPALSRAGVTHGTLRCPCAECGVRVGAFDWSGARDGRVCRIDIAAVTKLKLARPPSSNSNTRKPNTDPKPSLSLAT